MCLVSSGRYGCLLVGHEMSLALWESSYNFRKPNGVDRQCVLSPADDMDVFWLATRCLWHCGNLVIIFANQMGWIGNVSCLQRTIWMSSGWPRDVFGIVGSQL